MALDRQSIEKRDFPIGRRGYDPASVDAHLTKVAREIEALQLAARAAPGSAPADAPVSGASLASVAGAQVQAIIEAAETSATSIEREARELAAETEQDAARDSQRIRDEALARSKDHVGKVHEASALMLQRVEAMESELSALVDALRSGANRLSADLSLLSDDMGELYAAAGHPPPAAAVGYAPEVLVEEVVAVVATDGEPDAADGAEPADEEDDAEGARLIALNMALNGQTRAETDRYLAENFDLGDRDALLDEVYATVEG